MGKLRHVVIAILVGFAIPATVSINASAGSGTPSGPTWSGPRALGRSLAAAPATAIRVPGLSLPAAPACDGGFNAVASQTGSPNSYLFATAAVSANDVWAVGIANAPTGDVPISEHWNGSSWSIVTVPNPSPSFAADFNGVTAVATNDVWAVGDYVTDSNGDVATFAEHWDGVQWNLMLSTPNPSSSFNLLLAVTAVSSTDVWAVGEWFDGVNVRTLTEQWNGTSWSIVPSPNGNLAAGVSQLFSISAFSATDIWAVGSQNTLVGTLASLAEHWDGTTWSVVTTPNESGTNEIAFVNALEADHAVGVGYGKFVSGTTAAQSEAWDLVTSPGTSSNLALPGPGTGDNILEGVDRSGAGVWAVGFSRATSTSARQTMVRAATWNSATHTLTWGSLGTSASPSSINNVLFAVSAVSPYTFWASGYDTNSLGFAQTLIEGYCALHFSLSSPPACVVAGQPFPITVTVRNGSNTVIGAYRGTVHFTSSDGSAILPADYTFTATDSGSHTFMVTLQSVGSQTITVSDIAMPLTTPAMQTAAVINGACQAPTGTSGSRTILQSPPGTPGPRLIAIDRSSGVRTADEQSPAVSTSPAGSVTSVASGGTTSVLLSEQMAELLALAFFTA
jgi:hypothetical protein